MSNLFLAGAALLATLVGADSLQQQLDQKEAEIRRLRARIEALERQAAETSSRHIPSDPEMERALERALVRETGLLLPRGALEIEPNFVYSHFNDRGANFQRDAYGPGITLRIGLPSRSQLDVELPYVFEHRREGSVSSRSSGPGDLALGLSRQLARERNSVPGVIGSLRYQMGTGENTVLESTTPVAHGAGYDSLEGSLTVVKRMDPLVFFGSYSHTNNFSATQGGMKLDAGYSQGLRFGTLLAASPHTSLRALFELTLPSGVRVDGTEVPGSDDPVGMLMLGGSAVLSRTAALDISVEAGLTSNAPDYRITAALPIRFR